MSNKIYAGIGARDTPEDILYLMKILGIYLAGIKYTLNTGAAKGADQAFARGAVSNGGKINLVLPWKNYEAGWIEHLIANNFINKVSESFQFSDHHTNSKAIRKDRIAVSVFNKNIDIEAVESVHKLHPNPSKLKDSVIALHARNYLILKNAKFAICYTKNGVITGGTGQAIRIMENFGRKVFNLGREEDRTKVIEILEEMK